MALLLHLHLHSLKDVGSHNCFPDSLPGKIGLLERIRMILQERSSSWLQCVEWAYLKFQELFRHTPSSLLRSFADSGIHTYRVRH